MNFADAACEPGLLEAVMPGKESLSWEEFCYDNSSYELNSKLQFCKFAKSCKPTSAPFKSELTSFTNTSRLTCNLWNARDDNGLGLVMWIRMLWRNMVYRPRRPKSILPSRIKINPYKYIRRFAQKYSFCDGSLKQQSTKGWLEPGSNKMGKDYLLIVHCQSSASDTNYWSSCHCPLFLSDPSPIIGNACH